MTTYENLADSSRVWVYQSNRPFTAEEIPALRAFLQRFATNWVSHNRALQAFAELYYDQFIVLMVDESQAGASGCSIDASVRFLQQLEQEFQVSLFDRLTFAYKENGQIKTASKSEFKQLYQDGKISNQTLVFDNLVENKKAFEQNWVKLLKESWHRRMV
ncbi:MAG: hypothetical protein AAGI23_10705 [Bacteroidota bacterium]